MTMHRTAARIGLAAGISLAVLALPAVASAHVTVSASETAAGSYTVLTVSVPHGCAGSATTELAIQMPEGINEVTPTRNPFYDVEKVQAELDEPITDAHGNTVAERTSEVVYSAQTPLPDGERDSFELSFQIPEDAAGQTLTFPSIQTCEEGETAWTEVPADGQDEDELEHPAPSFVVTEPTGDAHGSAAASDEPGPAVTTETESSEGETSQSSSTAVAWVGVATGTLGLLLGGFAVLRTRRS